jgi:hypothetical protein
VNSGRGSTGFAGLTSASMRDVGISRAAGDGFAYTARQKAVTDFHRAQFDQPPQPPIFDAHHFSDDRRVVQKIP